MERGKKKNILLLPGWATDSRIFSLLDLDFNYIIPTYFWPFDFEEAFIAFMDKEKLTSISLFGLSLGGFVAVKFAEDFSYLVDELILVGIREKYKEKDLEKVRNYLKKDKNIYLRRFYKACFYPDSQHKEWFKKTLEEDYIKRFSLNYLIETLNYFKYSNINLSYLTSLEKIKVIHGSEDSIVPLREAKKICFNAPSVKFICIEGEGHFPFFHQNFSQILINGR
jgi:pimeloyl-ACP methyl ester carboxylesterase